MKRKTMCLVLALTVVLSGMLCGAEAEVYLNREKPADWYERELLTITMMDFYQNDAFVLQCGGAVMLIDGGVRKHWKTMMEWLEENGISHVNILFNTHPHDDHLDGQIHMLSSGRLTADVFISPFQKDYNNEYQKKMVALLDEKGIPYVQMMPEEELVLGRSTVEGYQVPEEGDPEGMEARMILYRWPDAKDTNSRSGVLWLHYGDATILLPGDLTGGGERWMATHYGPEGLHSDILKSPHHGIVRMVPEFLKAVDPALTVITNRQTAKAKSQLDTAGYANICTSGGIVVLETDGKDWYVTQSK